jgi:hypothetical protein
MAAERRNTENDERPATSAILEKLLDDAPHSNVTLNWLIDNLGARSFGIVMLLIGLVGLIPGASPFIGVLLVYPAIQMVMARPAPVLPGIIARQSVETPRLARSSSDSFRSCTVWNALSDRVGAPPLKQRSASSASSFYCWG